MLKYTWYDYIIPQKVKTPIDKLKPKKVVIGKIKRYKNKRIISVKINKDNAVTKYKIRHKIYGKKKWLVKKVNSYYISLPQEIGDVEANLDNLKDIEKPAYHYLLKKLKKGKIYKIQIRAYYGKNKGKWSKVKTIKCK